MEGWVRPGPGCKEQLAHGCYTTTRGERDPNPDLAIVSRACWPLGYRITRHDINLFYWCWTITAQQFGAEMAAQWTEQLCCQGMYPIMALCDFCLIYRNNWCVNFACFYLWLCCFVYLYLLFLCNFYRHVSFLTCQPCYISTGNGQPDAVW